MNKILTIAALALVLSACSNEDNDIQTPVEQPAKSEGIPFTATISIGENAMTRALTEDATNNQIVPTWAAGEKVALIHNGVNDEMSVASVSGGVATITGTITGSPTTGDAVTVIYPATAADGTTGNVKADLLTAQDGTLATIATNYDVRKGTGTLKVSGTASLNGNVSLTNQFAIWKLTLDKTAKDLYITAGGEFLAGATLASAGTEFTVAVPSVSSKTVAVVATDGSSNCWSYSKAGVTIAAGKYYQSSPTMTALGDNSSADVYKMTAAGTIDAAKTVVLSGVNISGSLECSGDATIILMGDNSVTSSTNYKAAIKIGGSGTTLTIMGKGSLTAKGGSGGAGIGTDGEDVTTLSGGNIVINGGTIYATGGNNAAGIGTGSGKICITCGAITINGGIVTATGGNHAAGIGTGNTHGSITCGAITISGGNVTATGGSRGASIGTGYSNGENNTCGAITISGGIVTATGGYNAAGIGTGSAGGGVGVSDEKNTCGAITIGTGVTSVTAKRYSSPNSIGKGEEESRGIQICGTITFGTAQVFNGTAWSPSPMVAGSYGGLNLAISTTTTTDDTWILTPVAP